MKILLINKFLYPNGGDVTSTFNTGELLNGNGHSVFYWGMNHPLNQKYKYENYFASYVNLNNHVGIAKRFKISLNLLYSIEAKKKIEQLILVEKPDIVHLHNIYHQISPSIIHSIKKFNIPIVMTLHDYKIVCASYTMLNKGKVCHACRNGRYYQCYLKKCTKDSRMKSLLNTIEMYLHHKFLHIYNHIDVFISPSKFLKSKLEEMNFRGRVEYLPNFIKMMDFKPEIHGNGKSIIYFGRLSREKGLFTLIMAVKDLDIKLKIIGNGPIRKELDYMINNERCKNVHILGYKHGEDLKNEIRKAMFVVLPSEWYENNPFSIIEAFSFGKTVIASRIGGIPELVKNNETGLTFEPGNSEDLRLKIEYLKNIPEKIIEMGKNARNFIEQEFNAEKHYQRLVKIYNFAINKN